MISDLSILRVNPMGSRPARVRSTEAAVHAEKAITKTNFISWACSRSSTRRARASASAASCSGERVQPPRVRRDPAVLRHVRISHRSRPPTELLRKDRQKDLRDDPVLKPQADEDPPRVDPALLPLKVGKIAVRALFQLDYCNLDIREVSTRLQPRSTRCCPERLDVRDRHRRPLHRQEGASRSACSTRSSSRCTRRTLHQRRRVRGVRQRNTTTSRPVRRVTPARHRPVEVHKPTFIDPVLYSRTVPRRHAGHARPRPHRRRLHSARCSVRDRGSRSRPTSSPSVPDRQVFGPTAITRHQALSLDLDLRPLLELELVAELQVGRSVTWIRPVRRSTPCGSRCHRVPHRS